MKHFMKWTVGLIAAGAGAVVLVNAVQAGRRRLKHALGQAEAIADRTRATLEQTETALRETRQAI